MITVAALLIFGVVFIIVSALSEKFTPLVAIGGLLVLIGLTKLLGVP